MNKALLTLLAVLFFAGCGSDEDKEVKNIYTSDLSKKAFSRSLKLNRDEEDLFILGKSYFSIPWVEAPSATTARDGLGPLFNANTCKNCHPNNSSGIALNKDGSVNRALLLRLSLSHEKNINHDLINQIGFIPEPTYGVQLATNGNMKVPYEGVVKAQTEYIKGRYDDGTPYQLRSLTYTVRNLQYGAMSPNVNLAPRLALPLIGLGFLQDIDEREILKNEDVEDSDKDGISGKANRIYSPQQHKVVVGRFAYKATAADIKQQSANAAHNDMGLTNPLYPQENCTKFEEACVKANKGVGEFDLTQQRLDAISFYLASLKVPAQRVSKHFEEGKKIFNAIGCVKCHRDSFTTKSGVTIHPYTDLLLHDMGEGLDDGHSDFLATSCEFRTTPLWGISVRTKLSEGFNLLHDGRARSYEEAILWHGGEARHSQEAFKALSKEQRGYLVEFLKGI